MEHDRIVGAISHLPHVIAVALVNQVCDYNKDNPLYRQLAAGGFRDITRIASSDPIIWRDILLNNRDVMLQMLSDWNNGISAFVNLLKQEDGEGIVQAFAKANDFRSELPERRKGMIASTFDLYIDVPDHPGIIGKITTILGENHINLSNIKLSKAKGGCAGHHAAVFPPGKRYGAAKELLNNTDYSISL